jgi:hypothetical protein
MIIYTNQTSKKNKKLNAKQRELQKDWNQLMTKWSVTTTVKERKVKPLKSYSLQIPADRNPRNLPSVDSGVGNATKPIEGKRYTGTKMLGIGTLHKSNAVPVFTDEEAKDQANMRR